MNLELELYKKLSNDKIKINWNKNPIRMDLLLSFLTIPVTRSSDHLGSCNGWTLHVNEDTKLRIGGGVVGNIEYLDTLQYGTKLQNQYNNYVNPFYMFDILTEDGRKFFAEYYRDEIDRLLKSYADDISVLEKKLESARAKYDSTLTELKIIR